MSAEMSQFSALAGAQAALRILVVDDEELARMRLRSLVGMPAPGESITLQVRTEAMHLFDPVTELRLR